MGWRLDDDIGSICVYDVFYLNIFFGMDFVLVWFFYLGGDFGKYLQVSVEVDREGKVVKKVLLLKKLLFG